MNKPCPFCGDTRNAAIEEIVLTGDPSTLFHACCRCCGAEGPPAPTRGAALIMWDERRAAGDTEAFVDLANRLAAET